MQLTLDEAALHHVEQHSHHDVQQLALLRDVAGQLLIAEQLHADVHDAVGHGVRLVALHQCLHDEGVVLHKGLGERDLQEATTRRTTTINNTSWGGLG